MPPVPFQQFVGAASLQLDKASGVAAFRDVIEDIIPVLDVSPAQTRWIFRQFTVSLTIGQLPDFSFRVVPRDVLEEYHYIALVGTDIGPKGVNVHLHVPAPTPVTGLAVSMVTTNVDFRRRINLLGHVERLDDEDGFHGRPLLVPPGYQLGVQVETGLVGAGSDVSLVYLRKLLPAPFIVEQAAFNDVSAVIT